MAYTGTGTEADPYIVSNLTDFLECIAISNVYVKLEQDIDAAKDDNYIGELTDIIINRTKKIYADSRKSIIGLTVRANSFMNSATSGGIIENIDFINCTHKKIGVFGSFIGNGAKVNNCNFSFKIVGYYANFSSSHDFTDCGFYIDYSDLKGTESNPIVSGVTTRCSFILKNMILPNYGTYLLSNATLTSVVLDSPIIKNNFYIFAKSYHSYLAILNPIFENVTNLIVYSNVNSSLSLFLIQGVPDDITVSYGKINNNDFPLITVTAEQLKDKEYLESIGFFP